MRRLGTLGVLLVLFGAASAHSLPDGGTYPFPDGGPGGFCTNDIDCPGCGWVCSWPRGHLCIPSMEGDPGRCGSDSDCACAGQTCSGTSCTPSANPPCACNSDCPAGQVCDSLLYTCHAPSPVSCNLQSYHGDYFGEMSAAPSCGVGYECAGGSSHPACAVQCFSAPPECSSDLDCNVAQTGMTCVIQDPPGLPVCAGSLRDGGWCALPPACGATGGTGSGGCGCGVSGNVFGLEELALGLLLLFRRRRSGS